MTIAEAYTEAKSWQPLFGSVLGFGALALGALYNFHLNRRRDALLRKEEGRSVLAALYGEIVVLREHVGLMARAVAGRKMRFVGIRGGGEVDEHIIKAYGLDEPYIYKQLVSRLGLIESNTLMDITNFYRNYEEARKWLPLLVPSTDRKYDYFVSAVLKPACDAVTGIEPSLARIEALLSLRPSKAVSLGSAPDAIEEDDWVMSDQTNG